MRFLMGRFFVTAFLVAASVAAVPAQAATVIDVPLVIDPTSVVFGMNTNQIESATPATLPISVTFDGSECFNDQFTFSAQQIGAEMEIEISGIGGSSSQVFNACDVRTILAFDVTFTVPEFEGTTTTVARIVPEVLAYDDTTLSRAQFRLGTVNGIYSQTLNAHDDVGRDRLDLGTLATVDFALGQGGGAAAATPLPLPLSLVPGDTATTRLVLINDLNGLDRQIEASYRLRFALKVVVPEPAMSLSLPIGVGALAGLSVLRGPN